MRGIARTGFLKPAAGEKGYGAPTASLPDGADIVTRPLVVGVTAVLHNPKNIPYGSVNYAASRPPALTSSLRNRAFNAYTPPVAVVSFTAYYALNTKLFVAVVYSTHWSFPPGDTVEKNLIVPANSGVTFSLNNLLPDKTYYVRAQARVISTGISSIWAPSPLLEIKTPVTPTNGVFAGRYHINGQVTSLNQLGTGEWDGVYYILGQPTGLVEDPTWGWSGVYNGEQYYNGELAHGLINGQWWRYGSSTTEAFFYGGNGHLMDGLFYQNYRPFTGKYNGEWYFQGELSPFYQGQAIFVSGYHTYYNGVLFDGLLGGIFYVGGMQTTLGPNGVGIWNNAHYSGGVYVGDVGNPYDSGQTSSQGSSFSEGVTYG